jgi:hypothetical protein
MSIYYEASSFSEEECEVLYEGMTVEYLCDSCTKDFGAQFLPVSSSCSDYAVYDSPYPTQHQAEQQHFQIGHFQPDKEIFQASRAASGQTTVSATARMWVNFPCHELEVLLPTCAAAVVHSGDKLIRGVALFLALKATGLAIKD